MEDNEKTTYGFPKANINKESVIDMLNKVISYKLEERDLALDKFKKMENESFDELEEMFPKSKQAIEYLRAASAASNYMGDLVKEVMKYAIGDYAGQGANSGQQQNGAATGGLLDTSTERFRMAKIAEESLRKLRLSEGSSSQETSDEITS
jgi:riboflavin synthase